MKNPIRTFACQYILSQFFLTFSKHFPPVSGSHNNRNELCRQSGVGGYETCSTSSISESQFYILVHAFESHRRGTLTLTGSNMISVRNQTETEQTESPNDLSPIQNHCQQLGLYQKIENITTIVEKTGHELALGGT